MSTLRERWQKVELRVGLSLIVVASFALGYAAKTWDSNDDCRQVATELVRGYDGRQTVLRDMLIEQGHRIDEQSHVLRCLTKDKACSRTNN